MLPLVEVVLLHWCSHSISCSIRRLASCLKQNQGQLCKWSHSGALAIYLHMTLTVASQASARLPASGGMCTWWGRAERVGGQHTAANHAAQERTLAGAAD